MKLLYNVYVSKGQTKVICTDVLFIPARARQFFHSLTFFLLETCRQSMSPLLYVKNMVCDLSMTFLKSKGVSISDLRMPILRRGS